MQPPEAIELTLPAGREWHAVARLVLGGVADRMNLSFEDLDDLQLALGSLLEYDEADEGEVSVVLRVGDGAIDVSVGPVGERTVAELEGDVGETLGLRRLLDTTVDDATVSTRNGGAWVELRKGFAPAEPQA